MVCFRRTTGARSWTRAADRRDRARRGERTCALLFRALQDGGDLRAVPGLALRTGATPPAQVIADLDRYRVGWELIDHRRYSYWGGMRAVVVQFSRGCPHPCTYCGQRGFWTKWRYRDPVKFAGELARLYREHGVELINFADENPTVDREAWKRFLEALIAENVPLTLSDRRARTTSSATGTCSRCTGGRAGSASCWGWRIPTRTP